MTPEWLRELHEGLGIIGLMVLWLLFCVVVVILPLFFFIRWIWSL